MARKKDGRETTPQSNIVNQQALQSGKGIELHDTFRQQLEQLGLQIRDMPGDGNCLFRALGDQLDGHCRGHLKHRHEVTQFMFHNRRDFEPFVEDDVPFEKYIRQLRQSGTYAGNDVIVAFARLHKLDIIIHQMNTPPWVIQGGDETSDRQLHISYSNGDHYSSIRRIGDTKLSPANIKIKTMYLCEDPPVAKKPIAQQQQQQQQQQVETNERLVHDDDFESALECITAATDCADRELLMETLLSCDNDVEKCIGAIMTMLCYNHSDDNDFENSTPAVQNGARPKTTSPKLSAKAERKLNKRERAAGRHKAALLNNQLDPPPNKREDETLVKPMSTLQI